jgi:hypothetical protein
MGHWRISAVRAIFSIPRPVFSIFFSFKSENSILEFRLQSVMDCRFYDVWFHRPCVSGEDLWISVIKSWIGWKVEIQSLYSVFFSSGYSQISTYVKHRWTHLVPWWVDAWKYRCNDSLLTSKTFMICASFSYDICVPRPKTLQLFFQVFFSHIIQNPWACCWEKKKLHPSLLPPSLKHHWIKWSFACLPARELNRIPFIAVWVCM